MGTKIELRIEPFFFRVTKRRLHSHPFCTLSLQAAQAIGISGTAASTIYTRAISNARVVVGVCEHTVRSTCVHERVVGMDDPDDVMDWAWYREWAALHSYPYTRTLHTTNNADWNEQLLRNNLVRNKRRL
jgi:hypothetical protein